MFLKKYENISLCKFYCANKNIETELFNKEDFYAGCCDNGENKYWRKK